MTGSSERIRALLEIFSVATRPLSLPATSVKVYIEPLFTLYTSMRVLPLALLCNLESKK
jgi:hypothetical protein